ncbi:Multidrug resistance-associated protein 1, partial [Coemansia sp. RSA 2531]
TGSGKSSLLLAMCSEVEMTQGAGRLVGRIAYLEQQPWIMNDTLCANILFGRDFDEDYYWKVLSACALTDDLEMWPKSDLTIIGENGINISGSQRARLALARTVYSKADIYFLDDPLSAVDAIVKRHILDNIILSKGLLGDKLRFVTTHADNILPLCNQIATVDDGHVLVKVQTPQVHTAFKFKAQTKSKKQDVDHTSKDVQATTTSDDKQLTSPT